MILNVSVIFRYIFVLIFLTTSYKTVYATFDIFDYIYEWLDFDSSSSSEEISHQTVNVTCRTNCTLNVVCHNCTTNQDGYIDAITRTTLDQDSSLPPATSSPLMQLSSSTIAQMKTTLLEMVSSKSSYPDKTVEIPAVSDNTLNVEQKPLTKDNHPKEDEIQNGVESSTVASTQTNDSEVGISTDSIVPEQTDNANEVVPQQADNQ